MNDVIKDVAGTTPKLMLVLNGGAVRRYHSQGFMQTQTVQEHTWRMLAILLHLWPETTGSLLRAVIYHDVPEGLVGDASAPVKRDPVIRKRYDELERDALEVMGIELDRISMEDYYKLKCVDYLELCMYCRSQKPTRQARDVFTRGAGYVKDYAALLFSDNDREAVLHMLYEIERGTYDE